MARGAAHADDHIPTRGRPGILRQVTNQMHAVMARRFEPKCRSRAWQRQIVINRLRDVRDTDLSARHLIYLTRRKSRVIASNADQRGDAQLFQRAEHMAHALFGFCRIGSRGSQDRTAPKMYPFDASDSESHRVFRVPLRKPFISVTNTKDFKPLVNALNGCGADHTVNAWRWPTAD